MAHYCDESNTYYAQKMHLEVIQTPPSELDLNTYNDNPTEGINYE